MIGAYFLGGRGALESTAELPPPKTIVTSRLRASAVEIEMVVVCIRGPRCAQDRYTLRARTHTMVVR